MKQNWTYQLLVYTDCVNSVDESMSTMTKNRQAVVRHSVGGWSKSKHRGNYVHVLDSWTEYKTKSQHTDTQQILWMCDKVQYLGMTLTNQNSVHDETDSSSYSGNTCHISVQNLM